MVHIKFSLRFLTWPVLRTVCCVNCLGISNWIITVSETAACGPIYFLHMKAGSQVWMWRVGWWFSDSENHDLALSSPLLLSRSFMCEVTESLYTQDSDTWGLQCKDQDLSGLYRRNKSMKWMLRLYVCVGRMWRAEGRENFREKEWWAQSLGVCSTFKEFIVILDIWNAEFEMKVARQM